MLHLQAKRVPITAAVQACSATELFLCQTLTVLPNPFHDQASTGTAHEKGTEIAGYGVAKSAKFQTHT